MENVTNFTNFEEFVAAVRQVAGQSERALTCLGKSGNTKLVGVLGILNRTVMLFKDCLACHCFQHEI